MLKRIGQTPWLPLLAAFILAPIANGANMTALGGWLFPVFLLRFVRVQRPGIGLPVAYVLLTGAFTFQFRGMLPLPGLAFYFLVAAFGVTLLMPYAVDRWLSPRLSGIAATLVFACAYAATEYLVCLAPYGSWGSIAYTQTGNLPVMQLAAVTGLWGITFLMAWFAAGCNALWENPRNKTTVWTIGLTVGIVFLVGSIRLAVYPPRTTTVRVSALSAQEIAPPDRPESQAAQRARTDTINQDLLRRAALEMQAGARIVFWAEGNAVVSKQKEADYIAQGAALARRYHSYLGMALAVTYIGQPSPFENKLVLVGPDGRIAWSYNKVRPVPGPEAAMMIPGDHRIKQVMSPYGRLSGIICFDGDFPQVLAQAGTPRPDILLVPANDWLAIDPLHTRMASFRAVEQGVNLIRQSSHGLSAAYDYQGHELAVMDHYQATDHTLVAQVPTHGAPTLYSRLSDWFAWLTCTGLIALALTSSLTRGKLKSGKPSAEG